MKRPYIKKLNRQGFHHVFVMAIAFIILFGAIGTYFLLTSSAAAQTFEISNGNTVCINDPGDQGQGNINLTAVACNQTSRQVFQQNGSGGTHTYEIFYNSGAPLCISSSGNHKAAGTNLQANKCGNDDANALNLYVNSCNQLEVSNTNGTGNCSGVCVDSASGAMKLSNCANAGNWTPKQKNVQSSGGGGNGGGGSLGSCPDPKTAAGRTPAAAQCDAKAILAQHNQSNQYSCMNNIFVRESGWRYNAENASGAYGIPQSLPGSKMAAFGSDWLTNPVTQIKWALSYMNGKYGSPCAAWSFWQGHQYYITNIVNGAEVHV